MEDPLGEIKQSVNQQNASINALQATLEERLDHLEGQFSTFFADS